LEVVVYTKMPAVMLYLNGKALGQQTTSSTYTAVFTVPYAAGNLTAVGLDASGVATVSKTLVTVSKGTALQLLPDRRTLHVTRDDLSYVSVRVVDNEGRLDPNAAVMVTVTVTGNGELAAVGSGEPTTTHQTIMTSSCRTYQGQCMAIVRPGKAGAAVVPGSITVMVAADGFTQASETLEVAD
jgi:beta-galactosidase